jgi:hypothetical protein
MAVIKQGILGGFSGKVGSVIGSSWKGRAVMKSQPLSVSNPNTAGQQSQRTKFKSITQLGSTLLSGYVQKVCNVISGSITGYNLFVQTNKAAFGSTGEFVPASFYVGGGNRPVVSAISSCIKTTDNALEIDFTRVAGESSIYDTDKAVFVCVCPSTGDVWVSPGSESKSTLTTTAQRLTAGSDLTGALHVHCYACFISSDGRYTSTKAGGTEFTVTF